MDFLILIVALMPFFSLALVPPTIVKANDNKQNLTIVYHKSNSDVTVEVLSSDGPIGRACSSCLSSGIFEKLPIVFDVDERGSGNLSIGSSTYLIHEDVNYSGGIVCARLFNHAEVAVSCTVAMPMDLPLKQLTESGIAECISGGNNSLARFLPTAASPSSDSMVAGRAGWTPPWANDGDDIDPHCGTWDSTEPLGDGDPHQNYYLVQLSENMFCGAAPGCTVGHTESEGVTITFKLILHIWCDNSGGGQYCVIGACQHMEFWYWDRDGRAGGP